MTAGPLLASSQLGEWSAAGSLGPVINSGFIDNSPELSKDGLSLYFASNRPGGEGSIDIYVSRRPCTDEADARCTWGAPQNLGPNINTPAIDGGPHLSRDGHRLYLISDRAGGFGSNDIWVSYRQNIHDDLAWEPPVNIGPPINSDQLEAGPNFRGSEFYFHRGPGVGNTDIFVSQVVDGMFGDPVMVAELSVPGSFDQRPSTRWDGREMIFSSDRYGTPGVQDIWTSTRLDNEAPWAAPERLGAPINTASGEQTPTINDDGTVLLFSSNRAGGSGGFDLYMAVRGKRRE